MKISSAALGVVIGLGLTCVANAKDFSCEGREGVIGKVALTLKGDTASVTGTYHWNKENDPDMTEIDVDCSGAINNTGRSGNKTHDYFDMNKKCKIEYVRTAKNLEKAASGWISLVLSGAPDHDDSGYTYANFYCQ